MSEKPKAWMALFIGDWAADTADLTCEEDGAYFRIVRHYWRRGAPPNDDKKLANIVGVTPERWRKIRPAIIVFFDISDGTWRHKRIEAEYAEALDRKARFVARASAGGKATAAKRRAKSTASSTASSDDLAPLKHRSSPSPSPDRNDAPSGLVILYPTPATSEEPADRSLPDGSDRPTEAFDGRSAMAELLGSLRTKGMP